VAGSISRCGEAGHDLGPMSCTRLRMYAASRSTVTRLFVMQLVWATMLLMCVWYIAEVPMCCSIATGHPVLHRSMR
jgi:hypothetical protein